MSPMHRHDTALAVLLVAVAAVSFAGCGSRQVDLAKALQVTEVTTGWFDAGIVEGNKNKLVPSVSLRLKNTDTQALASVQLFARFSQLNDQQEWGTPPYVRAIGPEGLPPGQSTPLMILRSNLGYTGEQPRLDMLQNAHFVDARVEIFVKYMANNWVKLADRQIARQLITR
jgi:hypothetical protein